MSIVFFNATVCAKNHAEYIINTTITKSGIDRNTDHLYVDFFLYDLFATDMY